MAYNFNLTIQVGHYEIKIDTVAKYGYFEHDIDGDERGGGLWFDEAKNLTDYDGMACLPKRVRDGLRELGFTVDNSFE
jgi:hypothetical protein